MWNPHAPRMSVIYCRCCSEIATLRTSGGGRTHVRSRGGRYFTCGSGERKWNVVFMIMKFSLPNPTIVVFSLLCNEVFESPEGVASLSWSPACCTAQNRRTKHRSREGTSHFSCFQQPLECTTGHVLLSGPSRVQETSNWAAPELDGLSVFTSEPNWSPAQFI